MLVDNEAKKLHMILSCQILFHECTELCERLRGGGGVSRWSTSRIVKPSFSFTSQNQSHSFTPIPVLFFFLNQSSQQNDVRVSGLGSNAHFDLLPSAWPPVRGPEFQLKEKKENKEIDKEEYVG